MGWRLRLALPFCILTCWRRLNTTWIPRSRQTTIRQRLLAYVAATAAHFLRKANPKARILIIDNHDDFGGHAKRNEFTVDGRKLLGYGGTFSIESPAPYSAVAKGLI